MAGWKRRNRVVVVFMGSQPAGSERNASSCSSGGLGRNSRWKRGLAYRRTEETALCSTGHCRNGFLFIGRGLAYRKTEETDLLRSKRGPVDREGCGVPQNRGNGLVLERYGRNGGHVHQEGCGVPQNGTPQDTVHLHRRPPPASTGYCSSTVDLLQPPPVNVHPASTARSSTGYCSTSPLHGVLFNHPTMDDCSSSPPPATVQPALHRLLSTSPPRGPVHPALHGVLLIQPSTGSCSSTGSIDRGTVHPVATASTTTGSC